VNDLHVKEVAREKLLKKWKMKKFKNKKMSKWKNEKMKNDKNRCYLYFKGVIKRGVGS
jgi:hypothetical protein